MGMVFLLAVHFVIVSADYISGKTLLEVSALIGREKKGSADVEYIQVRLCFIDFSF